jgi:hypothetical protein
MDSYKVLPVCASRDSFDIRSRDEAWHRLIVKDALQRVMRHRGDVVRQEDSPMLRHPFEDRGIVRAAEPDVLCADDVRSGGLGGGAASLYVRLDFSGGPAAVRQVGVHVSTVAARRR